MAKDDFKLPKGIKVISKLNNRELEVKGLNQKCRVEKNSLTGEIATTYNLTVFAEVKNSDLIALQNSGLEEKTQEDGGLNVRSYASVSWVELEKNGNYYYKMSPWKGWYDKLDPIITIIDPVVWAEAIGETYDGDWIGGILQPEHEEIPMTNENTTYTLYPSWGSEYIINTSDYQGQEGGTHLWFHRGTKDYEFEVRITSDSL